MSRQRILIAMAAAAVLAVLTGWNVYRQRLVERCLEGSGIWSGAASRCEPDPHRITIERGLRRT